MELICYLNNGYPSIEASEEMARFYTEAGCDIIEIDFPSRNPYLEGELIASRMGEALQACDDYSVYMAGMVRIKTALPGTKFILLAYENTVEEIGLDAFTDFCLDNGFMDLILVGMKSETVKDRLIDCGVRVSCYVQYNLDPQEVEYAKQSNGFVYLQGKPTDGKVNPQYTTLGDCVSYLRGQGIARPIYCGVGIHTPEDVTMAKQAGADGVFVGSAILTKQHDIPAMQDVIRAFKKNC